MIRLGLTIVRWLAIQLVLLVLGFGAWWFWSVRK
jgi:hypothetical protein